MCVCVCVQSIVQRCEELRSRQSEAVAGPAPQDTSAPRELHSQSDSQLLSGQHSTAEQQVRPVRGAPPVVIACLSRRNPLVHESHAPSQKCRLGRNQLLCIPVGGAEGLLRGDAMLRRPRQPQNPALSLRLSTPHVHSSHVPPLPRQPGLPGNHQHRTKTTV